jgi:hypothetical protein
MTFEDAQKQFNSAWNGISKMEFRSLTLFSEAHGLQIVPLPIHDLKAAQRYIAYKYLEKLCALNAINMPEKWSEKIRKSCVECSDAPKVKKSKNGKPESGRGGRAAIIKAMLQEGKTREEIKVEIARRYPGIPLSRVGCQIAATICFLKRKGVME